MAEAGSRALSITFEDTFVYSTVVDDGLNAPRAVTIAFFATATPDGEQLGERLKEHFTHVPMSEELWLVTAATHRESALSLVDDADLNNRLRRSSALNTIRAITFDVRGTWTEATDTATTDVFDVSSAQRWVQTAGLRRLFKDTGALLDAHAGLHYIKPGGRHTRRFIRAAAAVARSAHANFIAAALLGWASAQTFERIWVDTASITGVGYALGELLHTLDERPLPRVDSFGGHEGLKGVSFTTKCIALISASTSGELSRALEGEAVGLDRQRTLFYIGTGTTQNVLCDMSDREGDTDHDLVTPWPSWERGECPDCENQQNAIVLRGDAFTPVPGLATPVTLVAKYSTADHSAFSKHFFRKGVLSLNRNDNADSSVRRSVSVHLADYVATEEGRDRIATRLDRFIPFRTRYIIHADNPDARAIAEIALSLCGDVGLKDVEVIPAKSLRTFEGKLDKGVSLVIAGVVNRGQDLLNISRRLRKLIVGGGDIAYFIGVLRPPSRKVWDQTRSNLEWRTNGGKYPLTHVWYVETESAAEDDSPWTQEADVMLTMKSWLKTQTSGDPVEAVLDARIAALSEELSERNAFLNSDHGATEASMDMRLNPNFAFWDKSIGGSAPEATHAEVYFTMSTVLHRARHSQDGKYALFEQPGFGNVLSAENFNRFNDAVIQAALLRAARGRELRYEDLDNESRQMAAIICASLGNWRDIDQGGAALEFVLALIRGYIQLPGALRLADRHVNSVLDAGDSVTSAEAPLLELALRFLRSKVRDARS